MGPDAMILVFWMLSFKPTFLLSSFTFIKKLFSSSLSAIRVVSSAYLRLLIFLLEILIPACVSSSPAFRMMYSAYKLNKQSDNIQPWCTPFPVGNQSVAPCPILTFASWPAYRFLRRQVRWSGIPISLRIFHTLLIERPQTGCFSWHEIQVSSWISTITFSDLSMWTFLLPAWVLRWEYSCSLIILVSLGGPGPSQASEPWSP